MYPNTAEIHRFPGSKWTDPFKRLKLQHHSKRVSPFIVEKKEKKDTTVETPIPIIVGEEVLTNDSTPDLSLNNDSIPSSIMEEEASIKEEFIDGDADDEAGDYGDDDTSEDEDEYFPDLSMIMDRPLPPLPVESVGLKRAMTTSKIATKGQEQLKRATTWLGLAGQKIKQATPQVQQLGQKITKSSTSFHNLLRLASNSPMIEAYKENSLASFSTDEEEVEVAKFPGLRIDTGHISKSASHINKKTLIAPKQIMHCQVLQIINHASTRECEYELQIQLNNETLATKNGMLRKTDKSKTASTLDDEPLAFDIEEPFELNFVFSARHTGTSIREGLAKLGLLPQKSKERQPFPIVGHKKFNFENTTNVVSEMSRFKLINPDNRSFNIELIVGVKVEEILPALVEQFPWAFTTNMLSAVPHDNDDDSLTFDPFELPLSQEYCRGGDYLTVYTRGLAHPIWRRFWVTMEDEQLNLYDFTYKGSKEPLYTVPLVPLLNVTKPSFDDYDNVGISRKTGLMLYFNKNHAVLNEPVRLVEEEGLEGKVFLYADSEQGAIHWRRTLGAYLENENRAIESEERIDLRFLW